MTPDAVEPFGGDEIGAALHRVSGEKEIRKMTVEQLAEMSLESLLYYVLVGESRRGL